MGEFGSDDKSASVNRRIQESGQKRSYSVFRDCGEGSGVDGHIHKKIKGVDHKASWCLTECKATVGDELSPAKGQRGMLKKPTNHHRTTVTHSNVGHVCNKVTSRAFIQRRSAMMLTLQPSDPDDDHGDEVVRDGDDEKKKGESTKKQSKKMSITPANYQSEAERIKSFAGWPLNEAVHPEQLARVGFVYTGDGALVQCFQCGIKYHWYKGDVPLIVHQKCNPRCPFLQTLSSKSNSPPPEQRPNRSYVQPGSLPIGSNTQGEEVSKHSLQFPDYSNQAMRTRLKSFVYCSGSQELTGSSYMITHREVVQQDWDRSDNAIVQDSPSAANQLCIAKPESCRSSRLPLQSKCQRDIPDSFSRCFKSPTHSQSGSPIAARSFEQFTFKGSQQESESSPPSPPISFYYQRPMCYYRVEGTVQRIAPRHTLVAGMDSASVLGQDPPLSDQVSSDHPLDVPIHSQESVPKINHTKTHSGHVVEIAKPKVYCHPSLEQNQLLPNSDGGQKETVTPVPNQGQHQPLGTSRKVLSQGYDESFYSTECPHDTVEPPRTTTMYEESVSKGLENQYLPHLS